MQRQWHSKGDLRFNNKFHQIGNSIFLLTSEFFLSQGFFLSSLDNAPCLQVFKRDARVKLLIVTYVMVEIINNFSVV